MELQRFERELHACSELLGAYFKAGLETPTELVERFYALVDHVNELRTLQGDIYADCKLVS